MSVPNSGIRARAFALGRAMGVPMDAAVWLIQLEDKVAALEKKVAALEGPPHLREVEKRA